MNSEAAQDGVLSGSKPGHTTALPPAAPPPDIPDHETLRCIGRGSYGEVWLARSVLGEYRAVKVVYRRHFEDDRPFEREFEGIKKFEPISRTHESQVDILHVGRNDQAGCFYYVMELADDANGMKKEEWRMQNEETARSATAVSSFSLHPSALAQYAPRTLKSELAQHGRLSFDECLRIGLALTTALEHLHAHGLVHRDIKPSNIIFVGGIPKLADIGLVASVDATRSFVGTAGYLAPEGPGKPAGDLYSLGKVLYEISVGRDRQDFPALPEKWEQFADQQGLLEFNAIVLKACANDPRERYASAGAMRADLRLLSEGRSVRRRQTWQQRARLAAKLSLIATAAAAALWLLFPRLHDSTLQRSNASTPATLFVLPFRNAGTNQVDEILRSRITDALIDGLSQIDGVKVGQRKSGWLNRNEEEVRRVVDTQFGSRYALSGRVNANSNELSVTVALHDAAGDRARWSESFASAPGEQVELERRIIQRTAQNLGLKVSHEAMARITHTLQNNLKALELFQQAPGIGTDTRDDFSRKVEFLTQATTWDLRFAQAHAALAGANAHASEWHRRPKETMPVARREAQAAVDLDDTLADAHLMLGVVARVFDWDWRVAELEYKLAVELAPTSAWNHWANASYLRTVGRLGEARVESETAARLSPGLSPSIMAEQLYAESRFPEALASALKHLETDEDRGQYFYFGELYLAAGHIEKSIGAFEKTRKLFEGPDYLSRQGYAYARLGQREKAIEVLRMIERDREANVIYVSPYFIAVLHAGLGNTDECFTWLNRAIEDRCVSLVGAGLTSLASDPCWDDLRDDPRFAQLLDRLGLPPAAKELALRNKLPSGAR